MWGRKLRHHYGLPVHKMQDELTDACNRGLPSRRRLKADMPTMSKEDGNARALLGALSAELLTVKTRSEARARELAKSQRVRVALTQRHNVLVGHLTKAVAEQEKSTRGFLRRIASARKRARLARVRSVALALVGQRQCSQSERAAAVALGHAANLQSVANVFDCGVNQLQSGHGPMATCCAFVGDMSFAVVASGGWSNSGITYLCGYQT